MQIDQTCDSRTAAFTMRFVSVLFLSLCVSTVAVTAAAGDLSAIVAQRILKSNIQLEKTAPNGPTFLHHRHLSALEQEATRLAQDNGDNSQGQQSCDQAFLKCLGEDKCVNCFLELQSNEIDWASVTKDTPCTDVIQFLYGKGHCNAMKGNAAYEKEFCDTYNTCVIWQDDQKKEEDKIDCSTLTECKWPGIHPQFLGDGVCHDAVEGCYNTEICGYDGGDCCADTCNTTSHYFECGHDGYVCRNPTSANCNADYTFNCQKSDGDDNSVDPSSVECSDDTTLYRLVMYDSFGDGWDATKLTLKENGGQSTVVFEGGLTAGAEGTEYICLQRTAACYHVEVAGGTWGNEVSWEVKPYTDGAPAIAGGGAPMSCDFAVAGGTCETTCSGKPNIKPSDDPEYKEFKDMYNCITDKCPIQVGTCQNDPVCAQCFAEEAADYCFGVDNFNALVDCTLCKCTENKDSDFCSQKTAPGAVIPPADKKTGEQTEKPCSPTEIVDGGKAVLLFGKCTAFDEIGMLVSDFDQNNFGDLDTFESCAHSYQSQPMHGGHTALGCLQILVNAMNGSMEDEGSDSKVPKEAVASLAGLLYRDAENFCNCAKEASDVCPLCPSFLNFKTLLYESLDACQSLDEIDCDAWNEFQSPCKTKLQTTFGNVDFSKQEQCSYVHESCGGVGPFPAFRRLDCGGEIPEAAWTFYNDYARGCLNGDAPAPQPAPEPPKPTPAPAPGPAPTPPEPQPKPVQPNDNNSPSSSDKPPYVPPEERGKKKKKQPSSDTKKEKTKSKSHWFRNLVFLCLIGGGAWYYYKRRSDGFSFIRYRRMNRNFGGDEDMYSGGLMMESSTSFEPPSLPPRPDEFGGQYS